MSYRVEVTDHGLAGIREAVQYIAADQEAPLNAQRWLEELWDAISSLEQWPRRCALAEEDSYRPFEVRKLVHGNYLILFTIDDEQQAVFMVGLRHGMQKPRPDELPEDPAGSHEV